MLESMQQQCRGIIVSKRSPLRNRRSDFVRNLRMGVRESVFAAHPDTLADAIELARTAEHMYAALPEKQEEPGTELRKMRKQVELLSMQRKNSCCNFWRRHWEECPESHKLQPPHSSNFLESDDTVSIDSADRQPVEIFAGSDDDSNSFESTGYESSGTESNDSEQEILAGKRRREPEPKQQAEAPGRPKVQKRDPNQLPRKREPLKPFSIRFLYKRSRNGRSGRRVIAKSIKRLSWGSFALLLRTCNSRSPLIACSSTSERTFIITSTRFCFMSRMQVEKLFVRNRELESRQVLLNQLLCLQKRRTVLRKTQSPKRLRVVHAR